MDKSIERLIQEAMSLGRKTLVEPEAKEVLKLGSIPVPRFLVVKDVNTAVKAADDIGYPLVLKIVSPDIPHKSDVGGVALGLKDADDLQAHWSSMILNVADENPVAMIEGFMLEEMVPKGVEVIVGAINDDQFGVVVMFGTGGVSVELMQDVSFRLAPLDRDEAIEMIKEVRGFPLLEGYRGDSAKDVDAIAEVIIKIANIVEGVNGIKELEINPLVVYEKGAIAVDARAVLR